MAEELNLEGKWWFPEREYESLTGNLILNQSKKSPMLLIHGAFRGILEADIILGKLSNGQKVTLYKCMLEWTRPYFNDSRSSILAQIILLGGHFKTPKDIVFSSVFVTYRGDQINKWIKRFGIQGTFHRNGNNIEYVPRKSIKVAIGNSYNIFLIAKHQVTSLDKEEIRHRSISETLGLEIETLKEEKRSLEDYLKANSIILDFLNFILPQEVHIQSIHGIVHIPNDAEVNLSAHQQDRNTEEVKILYNSAIARMFKPDVISQPIFPYDESQRETMPKLFEKYLNKWFELSETPLTHLYCGVMFNAEMYMEYLFLGLAQAIESYHARFIRTKSQEKRELEEEVRKIGRELSVEKATRLEQMTKHCFDPTLRERVAAVYQQYKDVANSIFRFKHEEEFSKKVADTRNYLTHWSDEAAKKAVHDEELVLLTRDLQLLLQLCIMTQLGFTKEDIMKIYKVNYGELSTETTSVNGEGAAANDWSGEISEIVMKQMREDVPLIAQNANVGVKEEDMEEIEHHLVNTIRSNAKSIKQIVQQEGIDYDIIRRSVDKLFVIALDQTKKNRRNELKLEDVVRALVIMQSECKHDFPFWG